MTRTGYYVTLKRESAAGTKTAWLLGPFACHERAKAAIREAAEKAEEFDPRCFWDAHGTSSITTAGELPQGKLNRFLPHLLASEQVTA